MSTRDRILSLLRVSKALRKGFIKGCSLAILIVFIIILLAAIAIPNYLKMTERARKSQQNPTQNQQTEQNPTQNQQTEPQKPALELLGKTDTVGGYIVGRVRNNTTKEYSYVQISFNLYDKNMNQVGTAWDNINDLEPGSTWKFKALVFDESDVKYYKLGDLTGY